MIVEYDPFILLVIQKLIKCVFVNVILITTKLIHRIQQENFVEQRLARQ